MKNYVKPDVLVTKFQLNNSIALCSPEEVNDLEAASVTVHCVKTNRHEVFYNNCSSNYSNATKVTYGGQTYMQWPVGGTGDIDCPDSCPECNDNSTIYDALSKLYGKKFHYAPVTNAVKEVINSSL